jgi:DNA modification methylase
LQGDARDLPISDCSIDLVLTSPPYLNAIDYMRCSKFSLVWMGYTIGELRQLRRSSVGTEVCRRGQADREISSVVAKLDLRPALSNTDLGMLEQYIDDMYKAVAEVARVLTPAGKAVYVVGENTIRRTVIRTSLIVEQAAKAASLELLSRSVRRLPANRRYLPPPRGVRSVGLDARIRREVVLTFGNASPHGRGRADGQSQSRFQNQAATDQAGRTTVRR